MYILTMEVVIQFKEAAENSLDARNDPQLSWKCVENMYKLYEYMYSNAISP